MTLDVVTRGLQDDWPGGNPPSNLTGADNMFPPLNFTRPHRAACKVDTAYQAV